MAVVHYQAETNNGRSERVFLDLEAKAMTKSSRLKSKSKAGKGRRAAKSRASDREHAEDNIDGCDVEFGDSEATPDIALPPAKGGVGRRRV
jgi:hypothetical protein